MENNNVTFALDEWPNAMPDGMFAIHVCQSCWNRIYSPKIGNYCSYCGKKIIGIRSMTKEEVKEYVS